MKLETEAVWWTVPEDVLAALGGEERDAVRGLVHALRSVARLRTMAERSDLRGTSFKFVDSTDGRTRTAIVCYDSHPGGIGFASSSFDLADQLVSDAQQLLKSCPCSGGCPACVGDFTISKAAIGWALHNFREQTPPPESLHMIRKLPALSLRTKLRVDEVETQWAALCAEVSKRGDAGGAFLNAVERVRMRADKLVLYVGSPALAEWVSGDEANRQLRAAIDAVVAMPQRWRLTVEIDEERAGVSAHRHHKLRRRLEDLKAEDVDTEKRANAKLAGGFLVPGDGAMN